jgi:hypothetical protein
VDGVCVESESESERAAAGEPGLLLDGGRAFAFVVAFSRGARRGKSKRSILWTLWQRLRLWLWLLRNACGEADDEEEDLCGSNDACMQARTRTSDSYMRLEGRCHSIPIRS